MPRFEHRSEGSNAHRAHPILARALLKPCEFDQSGRSSAVIIDLRDSEGGLLEEVVTRPICFGRGYGCFGTNVDAIQLDVVHASLSRGGHTQCGRSDQSRHKGIAEAFASALSGNGRCVLVEHVMTRALIRVCIRQAGICFAGRRHHLVAPDGMKGPNRYRAQQR